MRNNQGIELECLQLAQLSSATTARVLATSRPTARLFASAVVPPTAAATLAASPATLPYVKPFSRSVCDNETDVQTEKLPYSRCRSHRSSWSWCWRSLQGWLCRRPWWVCRWPCHQLLQVRWPQPLRSRLPGSGHEVLRLRQAWSHLP